MKKKKDEEEARQKAEEARQKAEEEAKKKAAEVARLEMARLDRLHDQVMNEPRPFKLRRAVWWPSPWAYAGAPWRQTRQDIEDHVSVCTVDSDTESESRPRWK